MRAIHLVLILALVGVMSGCALSRSDPSTAPRLERESTPAVVADAYPAARSSADDIEAARTIAAAAVTGDITPDMLSHTASVRDEIPLQWWDEHDVEPYKVVRFTAQSPADLRRGGNWMHSYVVTQERPGAPWVLLFTDEGV